MSLKIFTNINMNTQLTETIKVGTVNTLYIKNIGNGSVNLYRIKITPTDVKFIGWLSSDVKSDKIITNKTIGPGEYISFYLQSVDDPSVLIKAKSIVDISLEYV